MTPQVLSAFSYLSPLFLKFENYASEIIAVSKENVETSFLVIEAFANSITATAKATGQTWPNVTIGDYTSQAMRMANLAGEGRVIFTPFVKYEDRLGFEEYARSVVYSQIQENLDYRGIDVNATDLEGVHQQIVKYDVPTATFTTEPYEGPDVQDDYLLNWQIVSNLFEKDSSTFIMSH